MRRIYYVWLLWVCICVNVYGLEGQGTKADPWRIKSLADFKAFASNPNYWDDYIHLYCDIDLSGEIYTKAVIAPDIHPDTDSFDGTVFTGVFAGGGHVIRNLRIAVESKASYLGLFGYIDSKAKVKKLGLVDVYVHGGDHSENIGGMCGYSDGGTIINCYATGAVSGGKESQFLGGLCGNNPMGTLTDCYATVSVKGDGYLGGLCGNINKGRIMNCYATGTVNGGDNSRSLGGLCGNNQNATITDCYATGSVRGWGYLGGLCGENYYKIMNCYATGAVSGGDNSRSLGGLCGVNYGLITECYAFGPVDSGQHSDYLGGLCGENYLVITDCYATGSISYGDNSEDLGGLCGYNNDVTYITNCFWDMEASGMSISDGGIGKSTVQMQAESTFAAAGWDFELDDGDAADWYMPPGSYPWLSWQPKLAYDGQQEISLPVESHGTIPISIYSLVEETINWTLRGYGSCAWIKDINPRNGSSSGLLDKTTVMINIDATGLAVGCYHRQITLAAEHSSAISIPVSLYVYRPVGLAKLVLLSQYWLMDNCDPGQPCNDVDWYNDGVIDIKDINQLARSWLSQEIVTYEP